MVITDDWALRFASECSAPLAWDGAEENQSHDVYRLMGYTQAPQVSYFGSGRATRLPTSRRTTPRSSAVDHVRKQMAAQAAGVTHDGGDRRQRRAGRPCRLV